MGLFVGFAAIKLIFMLCWPDLLQDISFSKVVSDRNGKILRVTLAGDEKLRIQVSNEQIPQAFKQILLIQEDRFFHWHPGFNPISLGKSIMGFVLHAESNGASTLTMQVARVRYGLKTKTVAGKLQQILYAIAIELCHTKEEILNAYYQLAPYGKNIEGIGAASLMYFRKKPEELSLNEMILLVLVPKDPNSRLRQLETEPVSKTSHQQNTFFKTQQQILKHKFAGLRQTEQYPVDIFEDPVLQTRSALPFLAPHFVEKMIRQHPEKNNLQTTLDLSMQHILEARIKSYLSTVETKGIQNAAALLIDVRSREVMAYVGSANYFNAEIQGQIDGLEVKRSPGSTLKPFLYGLAIQQGLIHPRSLLKDAPKSFGGFDPENFDRKFVGPMTAQEALIESRNVPAVQLLSQIGLQNFFQFLTQAGLRFHRSPEYYGLGAVLGTTEMSPMELAVMYASLANGGRLTQVKTLLTQKIPTESKQILSSEASLMTLQMLSMARRPSQEYRTDWKTAHVPVAWKTGTSFGFYDAWTAGIFGNYALVVWIGDFKHESNPNFIGREAAAPLFFQIVDSLRTKEMVEPEWLRKDGMNIKQIHVCSISGQLPGSGCQHTAETWFIPGVSPIKTCEIHRLILVNQKTGLRSCDPMSPSNRVQVFEFWPNDLLNLFQMAGIHRKFAPEFDQSCDLKAKLSHGSPPRIVSPIADVQYVYQKDRESIVLKALADSEVKQLYWFIDSQFIQSVSVLGQATAKMEVGDHEVFVVDDFGRSDRLKVTVTLPQ